MTSIPSKPKVSKVNIVSQINILKPFKRPSGNVLTFENLNSKVISNKYIDYRSKNFPDGVSLLIDAIGEEIANDSLTLIQDLQNKEYKEKVELTAKCISLYCLPHSIFKSFHIETKPNTSSIQDSLSTLKGSTILIVNCSNDCFTQFKNQVTNKSNELICPKYSICIVDKSKNPQLIRNCPAIKEKTIDEMHYNFLDTCNLIIELE